MKCPKCLIRSMTYFACKEGRFLYCKCGNSFQVFRKFKKKKKVFKKRRVFTGGEWKPRERSKQEISSMMNNPRHCFYMISGSIVSYNVFNSFVFRKDSSNPDRAIGTLEERLPPYPHKYKEEERHTEGVSHG
jgi:hypothetical protein